MIKNPQKLFRSAARRPAQAKPETPGAGFIGIVNIKPYANWLMHELGLDGKIGTDPVQPTGHGLVIVRPQVFRPNDQAAFFGTIDAALKAATGRGLQAVLFPTGNREDCVRDARENYEAIRVRCPDIPLVEVSSGRLPTRLGFHHSFAPANMAGAFRDAGSFDVYDDTRRLIETLAAKSGVKPPYAKAGAYDLSDIRKIVSDMQTGASPHIAVRAEPAR